VAAGTAADGAAVKPAECLKDGNKVSSMCGPGLQMTCTGSHGLGKCCSATGWCGNDPEFCGEGMQEDYSNAKNLCKDELPEGVDSIDEVESMCMTMDQVAVAWVSAVAKLDKADAQRFCVPAVIVAAGSTFGAGNCDDKFDPTIEAPGYQTTLKGLWQIADEVYDKDPKKQAAAAYDVYTGNNVTYGCNAEWCSMVQIGCSDAIIGIGQDGTDDSCPPDDPEEESSCNRFSRASGRERPRRFRSSSRPWGHGGCGGGVRAGGQGNRSVVRRGLRTRGRAAGECEAHYPCPLVLLGKRDEAGCLRPPTCEV